MGIALGSRQLKEFGNQRCETIASLRARWRAAWRLSAVLASSRANPRRASGERSSWKHPAAAFARPRARFRCARPSGRTRGRVHQSRRGDSIPRGSSTRPARTDRRPGAGSRAGAQGGPRGRIPSSPPRARSRGTPAAFPTAGREESPRSQAHIGRLRRIYARRYENEMGCESATGVNCVVPTVGGDGR